MNIEAINYMVTSLSLDEKKRIKTSYDVKDLNCTYLECYQKLSIASPFLNLVDSVHENYPPTIFQGLLPSEIAHTLSGECFSLNKSTCYLSLSLTEFFLQ